MRKSHTASTQTATHMAMVKLNHMANMATRNAIARAPCISKARSMVMFHRTSESWACASESAQSRRYEAVLEMQPRQNSIVSGAVNRSVSDAQRGKRSTGETHG